MQTIKIDKDSWHYKLAVHAGFRHWSAYEQNICSYRGSVIKGLLGVLALTLIFIGFSIITVNMLMGLVFSAIYGVWLMNGPGVIGLIAYGVIAVWGGIICAVLYHQKKREENRYAPPGALKAAYHSWKDKLCVPIELVDSKDSNEDSN